MRKFTFAQMLFVLLALLSANAYAQRITVTIAGNASTTFNGDGNPGVSAPIGTPYDVCKDAQNNIYFTDYGNGRVRKLWAKNGMVTTIAGGGTSTADGVPALTANIFPRNICIDALGNVYFTDSVANKVRKIDATTNIITTVAGNGATGYTGDLGLAIAATLHNVHGICADALGNLYMVDKGNNVIRKVTASTGIITTIAGTGTAGFSGDGGPATAATFQGAIAICIDPAGNLYVGDQADEYQTKIRKIDATTGNISTVIGGPSGTIYGVPSLSCWLGDVTGICLDDSGNCYFNEISCSCRERRVATDTVYEVAGNFGVESFADNVSAPLAYMDNPYGICIVPGSHLYAADMANNRIRKIIQLTHTPSFAYGEGQLLNICTSAAVSINSQLAITDLDAAQPETWTVVTPPVSGTLSGFPYTMPSNGIDSLTIPTGLTYAPPMSSFTGMDSFKVRVSDGTLSDIVTVYVEVGAPAGDIASTTASPFVCIGTPQTFTGSVPGGYWSLTNGNATVSFDGVVSGITTGLDTLVYTIKNSCGTRTTSASVAINDCALLGVNAANATDELNIFPNPVSNSLNVKWANHEPVNVLTITDVAGRELLQNEFSNNTNTGTVQVDVSKFPAGVYFVKINNADVRKFVKE